MRFATDTGGTFTDLVIEREGLLHLFKSPTVPSNPVEGVLGAFSEAAARASGVNAWAHKLIAFTISAFIVGLGGVLYGHFLGAITANMFWLDMTFLTLAMLVVGGMRSLGGAIVGALFVVAVREVVQVIERGIDLGGRVISAPEGSREIVLALILLGILIFRPQGLVGDREFGERK